MNEYFIRCDCHCPEHQAIITTDADEGLLFLEFHLTTWQNIFRRLWVAARYVFGYKCRYGTWDELVMGREQVAGLRDYLEKFLADIGS